MLFNELAVLYLTGVFASRHENDLMWNHDNHIYVFVSPVSMETVLLMHELMLDLLLFVIFGVLDH